MAQKAITLLLAASVPLRAAAATVKFTADLTWGMGAPDGNSRNMIFVNGTSPGPALRMNLGDTVDFTVNNNLPYNTTIHFHGITQLGSAWADGVPGLSQVPIPPGGSYKYQWTADEYGTYWYHGHEMGQIMDGLYGPIYIQPPSSIPKPFSSISSDSADIAAMVKAEANPHLVLVSDWIDITSEDFAAAEVATGYDLFCTNSILINGKGAVHCLPNATYEAIAPPSTIYALNGSSLTDQGCFPPTPLLQGPFPHNASALPPGIIYGCTNTTGSTEVFTVNPAAKWASFNFISGASLQLPVVSIDNHSMWIYAVDGLYVTPQHVDGVTLGNGERYSVMVKLNNTPADYTLRAASTGINQIISGFAKMSYSNGTKTGSKTAKPYFDYAGQNTTADVTVQNRNTLSPFTPNVPAASSNQTFIFDLGRTNASYSWELAYNSSFPVDYAASHPLLYNVMGANAMNKMHVVKTKNNTWVDIIIASYPNNAAPGQPPHPIHKHNNKAYIIGQATGAFNYTTVAQAMQAVPDAFNLENPPYRDTFLTLGSFGEPVWTAIRYQVINPGAFFFHCHIEPHLGGGMAMAILDGVDHFPTYPASYATVGGGY